MGKADANPLLVSLFFVARCLVPLFLMLGISYLLKKLGLIAEPPQPPPGYEDENNEGGPLQSSEETVEGDLAHGNT